MKRTVFVIATAMLLASACPALAQFGGLGKVVDKANQAKAAKDKYDVRLNEQQEKAAGDQVSQKLRDRFGVYQDPAVTKYVALVGTVLAKESSKPDLAWKFIVLDTDGVNAFAAPGGIIHITKGALGLIKSEAQLAGVLGHEITHVTERHTVHAIEADKSATVVAGDFNNGSLTAAAVTKLSQKMFQKILDGEYSQSNENDADAGGVTLANKVGYDPNGLVQVLRKIDERNSGRDAHNGMFASHPATKDRIDKITHLIASDKLNAKATVDARYKQNITFDALPASAVTTDAAGAAGLASGDKKKPDDPNADAGSPSGDSGKKSGHFGLSSISGGSKQANSSQQVSAAGARGVATPDRDSKGGPNKNLVNVTVTPAELASFKKGIVA
jgi:predicted Zn-dependent protease